MNYHEEGNTVSREYYELVQSLAALNFPANSNASVALSLPVPADDWIEKYRCTLANPFSNGQPAEGENWPVVRCARLYDQWVQWKKWSLFPEPMLRDDCQWPNHLTERQRGSLRAALKWCELRKLKFADAISVGAPWHLPFLCAFVHAADAGQEDGDRGYYPSLGNMFGCEVRGEFVRQAANPSWPALWQSVAQWANAGRRGFMLAELPQDFPFVGWPRQHVLLKSDERSDLYEWLQTQRLRYRNLSDFTVDQLKRWIRARSSTSPQLSLTLKSYERCLLLHHWAREVLEVDPPPPPPPAEKPLDDSTRGQSLKTPRCDLILELDEDGTAVSLAYLQACEVVDHRAFGAFEFGGKLRSLRQVGHRLPVDLRASPHLLRDTREITQGQINWANAETRYFVNSTGWWIEELASQIGTDVYEEVLVLCRRGSESEYVNGHCKKIQGLHERFVLLRCRADQLLGLPEPAPRVKLADGIRVMPASQSEYFGVALPYIRNDDPKVYAKPEGWVTVAKDGSLAIDETILDGDVPDRVSISIEAGNGARRSIYACFPRQRPSELPSDEDFRYLAERAFPDIGWTPALDFAWTPRRRLLCVYSTDSTSETVLKERIERLFADAAIDDRLRYLPRDLADLGHLSAVGSGETLETRTATTVTCTDARFEVIAKIRDNAHVVVARLVGAYDWVRLHGLQADGVEWREDNDEILVRGSLSDIRKLAGSLKAALMRCDRVGSAIDDPSGLHETPGLPWHDGGEGVEVWNPLYPLRKLNLDREKLQALVGNSGTIVLRQQAEFRRNYLRVRWDGRTWQRAPISGSRAADHYWVSMRNGWHRHGMVMEGKPTKLPLIYREASGTMYFLPRFRPPSEARRRLCSLAGALPRVVRAGSIGRVNFEGSTACRMYEGAPYLLEYAGVSKAQAVQLAEALGAALVSVG